MKRGYSPANKQDSYIGIRLNPGQKQRVEIKAEEYKMSVSEIIREAITIWLNLNSSERK